MKTRKSYTKRLRVTKNGKVLARIPGQGHFNAKESSKRHLNKKRIVSFKLTAKNKGRFMPYA